LHFPNDKKESGGNEAIHFGSTGCSDAHHENPLNTGYFVIGASGFLTIISSDSIANGLPFNRKILMFRILRLSGQIYVGMAQKRLFLGGTLDTHCIIEQM
jgi:hypothetical protein